MQKKHTYVGYFRLFMRSFLCLALLLSMGCGHRDTMVGATFGAASGAAVGFAAGSTVTGAAVGAVVGSVIADLLFKNRTIVEKLECKGVKIHRVGDELTIVIPADLIFMPKSPIFKPPAYDILDNIVRLVCYYPNMSVGVRAYTDNVGFDCRNFAISNQWAHNVVKYLWSRGIDTRLLHGEGKGACFFVANNQTAEGRAANRRIEISLRVLEI